MFHSEYQPTEPAAFHEMLDALQQRDQASTFRDFTFLDLGSGKGRTLLMASDYPFRRIVGVELLPALHQIAQENLRLYKNDAQKCFALEAICGDANEFPFPDEPLVIYMFNPLPESGMRRVCANLEQSLRSSSASGLCALSQSAAGACVERECGAAEDCGRGAIFGVSCRGQWTSGSAISNDSFSLTAYNLSRSPPICLLSLPSVQRVPVSTK